MKPPPEGAGGGHVEDPGGDFTADSATTRCNGKSRHGYGARQFDGHRRRFEEARRLGGDPLSLTEVALGRGRDWPRTYPLSMSDRDIEAWGDAARFILGHGYTPIVPLEVRRALWRRGGADRRLAERLAGAA